MKNKIKKIYQYLVIIMFLFSFFSFNYVFAGVLNPEMVGELGDQEQNFASTAGFNLGMEVGDAIATIIKGFLGLLGVIFVILIIYAGYTWMLAGGNEEKVAKAKDTIQKAIIGLIIIISAYSITYFVFEHLSW